MTSSQARDGANAVDFDDVVKVYHPGVRALDNVSFSIGRGEAVALLGPNGAGKTTAIDTMLGLRTPTSGQVRVLGQAPAAAVAAGRIGGMLQTSGLPEAARAGELVALFRRLYGSSRSQSELLALAGLSDLAGRPVDKLSGGQMQRVRFALALAGRPELLFLDEPTVGLDVESRRHFWQSLRTVAAEGTTVLFATHYLIAFRFEIIRMLRNVRFLVMLIAFPVMLYLIYGSPRRYSVASPGRGWVSWERAARTIRSRHRPDGHPPVP